MKNLKISMKLAVCNNYFSWFGRFVRYYKRTQIYLQKVLLLCINISYIKTHYLVFFFLFTSHIGSVIKKYKIICYKFYSCFCKVTDADTGKVLHDFGSIQKCHGWPTCSCRRHEMITCGDTCDQRVGGWLKHNSWKCRGRYVKKHYKASTCSQSYGHERRYCH